MRTSLRAVVVTGLFALGVMVGLEETSQAQEEPTGPGASAAPSAETEAESKLPPGFRPIRGKEESAQVDPNPLVVLAYGSILAGLFVYVIWMVRRQGQLAREIAELARSLERRP